MKFEGQLNPIWIFTRDGHDDPRFPTSRQTLIKFFKDHDIDYLIAAYSAAVLSAFHFIERRMMPLSKELAGIVLRHDSFGNHLDENGKTIDDVKELQNSRKAGETLSEIWSKMTIDDFEVSAKSLDPSDDSKAYHDFRDSKIGKNWLETHVYISKYCLQIEKCNNIECCQPMRSNVQEVLGGKFLPAPLALSGGPYLIDPSKKDETKDFRILSESCITAPTT